MGDQIEEVGRVGAGADPAPRRWGWMRTMSSVPLWFGDGGDVAVFGRRCAQSRRGVHWRAVWGGRGGDRGTEGRDGVADRGAGRRQPVVGRGAGAGLRQPGGARLVDDDYRLGHQRPDRVGHRGGRPGHPPAGFPPIVTVVGLFGRPATKQREAFRAPDGCSRPAAVGFARLSARSAAGITDDLDSGAVPAELHCGA